jgi:hypothetical protein
MVGYSLLLHALYAHRVAAVHEEVAADNAESLMFRFRAKLCALLDILSYEPPEKSARPEPVIRADGAWLRECNSPSGKRFDVVVTFLH